jgi:hypothetical protein
MKVNRTGIWIPVWIEILRLSHSQTKLLAEIVSLHEKGGCYASNKYLSDVLGLKADTISRMISDLKRRGLLKQTGFDGRRRFLTPVYRDTNPKPKSEIKSLEEKKIVQPIPSADKEFESLPTNTQITKPRLNLWNLFLAWSRDKVSRTTWNLIECCSDPQELEGIAKVYWGRWLEVRSKMS